MNTALNGGEACVRRDVEYHDLFRKYHLRGQEGEGQRLSDARQAQGAVLAGKRGVKLWTMRLVCPPPTFEGDIVRV